MKKIFALGVSGLLMIGAASQASAAFEEGNFIMSVYDVTANKELGIDLGAIADLSAQNVELVSGLDFTGWDFAKSGIGIFNDNSNATAWYHEGWLATNRADGVIFNTTFSNAQTFTGNDYSVRYAYALADSGESEVNQNNGITTVPTNDAGSYSLTFNPEPGFYNNVQAQTNSEAKLTGQDVDLYLYHFTTNSSYQIVQDMSGNLAGKAYDAKFTLTSDGKVILNEVPVPGAVWLLGSGLAGLAGIRRRKNS